MMHIRIEQETQVNNGDPLYGLFALVVIVIVGVWAVLTFCAPFFWYATNRHAREINEKLSRLIEMKRMEPRA
jgi:RsiW-degrading membrane proteinase PrsW (M82 family)